MDASTPLDSVRRTGSQQVQPYLLESYMLKQFLFYAALVVIFVTALSAEKLHPLILAYICFLILIPVVSHQVLKVAEHHFLTMRVLALFAWVNSFCAGLSIAFLNFYLIESIVIVGVLINFLIYFKNAMVWILSAICCVLGVVLASFVLELSSIRFSQAPLALDVVSVISLLTIVIVDIARKYKLIQKYEGMLSKDQANLLKQITITNRVARYTPIQVWEPIVNGKELKIDNKRKKITVFFSDIANFTDTSEKMAPDDLAEFLNAYFEEMSVIAHRYGGTIDKFMGDGLMIFFGDSNGDAAEQNAIRCVDMAVAMQRRIKALGKQDAIAGFDDLNVRMGISTGYCHVGNFGSATRVSYTALGPDVNLASRLQAECGPNEVLVSQATYLLVRKAFVGVKKGDFLLKGIQQPVEAWSIVDRFENVTETETSWIEFSTQGFYMQLDTNVINGRDRMLVMDALRRAQTLIDRRK